MIVSTDWLKEYIDLELSLDEIESGLTALGLECAIKSKEYSFSKVVVGKVISADKIEDSEHLNICKVDVGTKELEIVCGASNVTSGIYVPVAVPGATLDNQKFKIKKTKIRGTISNGMICSERELGISDSHEGIMTLDGELVLGEDFSNYLDVDGNKVIEIDLTPNRGDCFSHLGVARELAILQNSKINISTRKFTESSESIDDKIDINIIDDNACSRYACRIIKGVKVKESPEWLKNRLESIGQKSINNIVDAANYILFDQGHPMHVFDLGKVDSSKVIIKKADKKESLLCLDGVEREVDKDHLLICDVEKPIAIAGIIGLQNSCVDNDTTEILIESAYFDPVTIRRGAKELDISTDASKRFERDTDINNVVKSMDMLCSLIEDVSGGKILSGLCDIYPSKKNNNRIDFKVDSCNKLLGTNLSSKEIGDIFTKLSIEYKQQDSHFECIIPSYRNDLEREVDLHEEIARVYGYDNISSNLDFSSSYSCISKDENLIIKKISLSLSLSGFNEHYSNSLLSKEENKMFTSGMDVEISNPLSKDMRYLRNSIIPGILRGLSHNINHGNKNFKLFEVGNIHKKIKAGEEFKYIQENHLGIAWNCSDMRDWKEKDEFDLYMVKGEIEQLFFNLGLNIEFKNKNNHLNIYSSGKSIGQIIDTASLKVKFLDKNVGIYLATFNLDNINRLLLSKKREKARIPAPYPGVERDISFIIDKKNNYEEIVDTIREVSGTLLKDVSLFDLYEGKSIEKDQHSLALSFTFKSEERTLVDGDVDDIMKKIINTLKDKYNIVQR